MIITLLCKNNLNFYLKYAQFLKFTFYIKADYTILIESQALLPKCKKVVILRYYMPASLLIYPRRFNWKRNNCRSPRCKSTIEEARKWLRYFLRQWRNVFDARNRTLDNSISTWLQFLRRSDRVNIRRYVLKQCWTILLDAESYSFDQSAHPLFNTRERKRERKGEEKRRRERERESERSLLKYGF